MYYVVCFYLVKVYFWWAGLERFRTSVKYKAWTMGLATPSLWSVGFRLGLSPLYIATGSTSWQPEVRRNDKVSYRSSCLVMTDHDLRLDHRNKTTIKTWPGMQYWPLCADFWYSFIYHYIPKYMCINNICSICGGKIKIALFYQCVEKLWLAPIKDQHVYFIFIQITWIYSSTLLPEHIQIPGRMSMFLYLDYFHVFNVYAVVI